MPPFVGPAGPVTQVYGGTISDVEQFGLYGQLRLSPVAGVTLVGGGRVTWWDTDNQTLLPRELEPTGYAIDNRFTP
ncbi:hypothetical protein GCM10007973_26670 [Polymorphobacter multimanifer]|nr:hypothetical protein GCM10007973_26670 [Polymorphobacter multimanifer]